MCTRREMLDCAREAGNWHDSFAVKVVHASRHYWQLWLSPSRCTSSYVICLTMVVLSIKNRMEKVEAYQKRLGQPGQVQNIAVVQQATPTSCPWSTSYVRGVAYETEVKISAIKISSHGRPDENDECFDRRNIGAIRQLPEQSSQLAANIARKNNNNNFFLFFSLYF